MAISEDLEYELAFLEANGKELKWWELVCPNCEAEVTVVAVNDDDERAIDFEIIECLECGAQIKKIRADIGYRVAEIRKPSSGSI